MKERVDMDQKSTKRILVVNDDITQLCMISGVLEKGGYEAVTCTNAEDALRMLTQGEPPHAVVTDIQMPGMDGWRFCRALRLSPDERLNRVPVLMISAIFKDEESERLSREIGADGFLCVPFDAAALLSRVKALLSGRESRSRRKVLVVSADQKSRDAIAAYFDAHEFDVRGVQRLESHFDAIGREDTDVIVVSGFGSGHAETLVREIRRIAGDVVIAAVLPAADAGRSVRVMKAGADACVQEPVDPELLPLLCDKAMKERIFPRMEELLRKRSEEVLEIAEKYRGMMESISDLVYIARPDYSLEYLNPALSAFLDRVDNQGACFKIIYGRDRACPWCRMREVQGGRNARYDARIPGHELDLNVAVAPLRHHDGSTSHLGIIRDVTPQKRLEKQLAQARRLEAVGRLAGGVAHDFNNLLGAIVGYADIIRETNLGPGEVPQDAILAKRIETILSASNRAADLVRKLLAFSQQGKVQNVPVNIHGAIREAISLLGDVAGKGIEIVCEFRAFRAEIMGDVGQLRGAFLSLASNSRDAMPRGGQLVFRTEIVPGLPKLPNSRGSEPAEASYLLVTVSDTGVGISPEIMDRLFEPFLTTKEVGRGSGLGLASVHGTVESHGGRIIVQSEVNKGTVFSIYLPLAEAAANELPAPTVHMDGRNGRALLVDDEELVQQSCAMMLERQGYQVTALGNPLEAIEHYAVEHASIDVVVLDMTMPRCSGYECYLEMRRTNPDIRVILATGYGIDPEVAAAIERDGNVVLHKPFDGAQLRHALGHLRAREPRIVQRQAEEGSKAV